MQKPTLWKYSEYNTKEAPKNEMIYVPSQSITFGKNRDFPTYGWDCEYGELTLNVL